MVARGTDGLPFALRSAAEVTQRVMTRKSTLGSVVLCPPPLFKPFEALPSLPSNRTKRNEAVTEPGGTDGAYL